jgi:GNAT superfamily N-acetyltransferase
MGEVIDLGEGRRVRVRPLAPHDRDALEEGFQRLGPQSRYLRFFSPISALTATQLTYLTDIDHHDHEALVAVDERTRDGVGVARYVRVGAGVAEPAVAVTDDWQRRGVGSLLLDALADRARAEGIGVFLARVLAENTAVLALLERLGDAELTSEGREVAVRIALRDGRGAVPALRGLLRHAAEEAITPSLAFWQRAPRRETP